MTRKKRGDLIKPYKQRILELERENELLKKELEVS